MSTIPPTEPTLGHVLARLDSLGNKLDALDANLERLDLKFERAGVETQRSFFAIERRLGAIEDALADWAAHYWSHESHPPQHGAA